MNAQKLSAAIKLSIEAALSSRETTLQEAIGVLEMHKVSMVCSVILTPKFTSVPEPVPVTPVNGRG